MVEVELELCVTFGAADAAEVEIVLIDGQGLAALRAGDLILDLITAAAAAGIHGSAAAAAAGLHGTAAAAG